MELVPILNRSMNKNEMEMIKQQEKHLRLVNKMKKINGHTLFSFNHCTKEIKVAEVINNVSLSLEGILMYEQKTVIEPNCYYEQALNKKNFIKRLKRNGYL